ncbi:MAG TPA: hypothetical protein PLA94_08140, partial [Myxococcota bacterium]|nr:hypothetical protein [Myxococcota bacterium]
MERSHPSVGEWVGHLVQALVYLGLAREAGERWWVYAAMLGLAAAAQLVGLGASWAGKGRLVGISSLVSLLVVCGLYAEAFTQAIYARDNFGPMTGETVMNSFGATLALLPWVVLWPISRLPALKAPKVLLLLPLCGLLPLRAVAAPKVQADPAALRGASEAVWKQWQGGAVAELPTGTLVTPYLAGVPGKTLRAGKEPLVLPALPSDPSGAALVVELPVGRPYKGLIQPGRDAPLLKDPVSPRKHAQNIKRREIFPGVNLPAAADTSVRFQSALIHSNGMTELVNGWSPAPPLSPESLDASVEAGARHLIKNMQEDGRFTYIVQGPSGKPGRGYNYPRHAGTSWFLARAAAIFPDPAIGAAADSAIGHLDRMSRRTSDGRAYVLDPERTDGKAWVGTTALANMAVALRGNNPALLKAWTLQLAASVDAQGKVLGEMDQASEKFPDQPANPYGQGQAMLGLILAERAGELSGKEALDRAIAYVRKDYSGATHPLLVADEHWMCLVAVALHEQRQSDAADGVCAAYVAKERFGTPAPGGGLQPATGPAAGLAEAVIAWAWITKDPEWKQRSENYGWLFLRSQY